MENKFFDECKTLGLKRKKTINGKVHRELIELSDDFDIHKLIELAQRIVDNTTNHEIEEKNRILEAKDQHIHNLENNIILEQEKSRQIELMIKLQEAKNNQSLKMEEEEIRDQYFARKNRFDEIQRQRELMEKEFEEKVREIEKKQKEKDQLVASLENELIEIKKRLNEDPDLDIDPDAEFTAFVVGKCVFGDGEKDMQYRIPASELYDYYVKCVKFPYEKMDFDNMLKNRYPDLLYKSANWQHEVCKTWFGISLNGYNNKKITKIQQLIQEFLDVKCSIGRDFVEDTKVFYDKFEEYSIDKGYEVIKENGFSRQLFKKELFKMNQFITYKEWAIGGKLHGFCGVKLKDSPPQLVELTQMFVKEKCVKGSKLRCKQTDIVNHFMDFAKTKYDIEYGKIKFLTEFKAQNPELVKKSVTQSEKGFVGIALIDIIKKAKNENTDAASE